MGEIFLASEALSAGLLTRHSLQTKYRKVHQNVYAPKDLALTAHTRAEAAWLWSGRSATLAGYSAAAMLGSRWLPDDAPAELARVRYPSPTGIRVHSGALAHDEVTVIGAMDCTTVARTCYDIGRARPMDTGIIRIDALLNTTGVPLEHVTSITERYPGARGIRGLRKILELVDAGAESPQETRLRLLLIRSGLPRPTTQIPVGRRRVDMGWPQWRVGVEYDGEHHWSDPQAYAADIERLDFLAAQGWAIVRVSAGSTPIPAGGNRRPGPSCTRTRRISRRYYGLWRVGADSTPETVVSATYLTSVNCPMLVIPRRKKSAQPTRYFMYRS